MKCFYDGGDLDGVLCATILIKKYPCCELIDYNDKSFDMKRDVDPIINADKKSREIVYMIGHYKNSTRDIFRLNEKCSLTWIDNNNHRLYVGYKFKIEDNVERPIENAVLRTLFSKSELLWITLYDSNRTAPFIVKFVGFYHNLHDDFTNDFLYAFLKGLVIQDKSINNPLWSRLLEPYHLSYDAVLDIVRIGKESQINITNKQRWLTREMYIS